MQAGGFCFEKKTLDGMEPTGSPWYFFTQTWICCFFRWVFLTDQVAWDENHQYKPEKMLRDFPGIDVPSKSKQDWIICLLEMLDAKVSRLMKLEFYQLGSACNRGKIPMEISTTAGEPIKTS